MAAQIDSSNKLITHFELSQRRPENNQSFKGLVTMMPLIQQFNMHIKALLVVLMLASYGCTKTNETTLTPASPIIGEWTINRIVYSGFPTPLRAYDRTDSNATRIGTDSYIFRADSTYIETYSGYNFYSVDSLTPIKGVETGRWKFTTQGLPTLMLKRDIPLGYYGQDPYPVYLISTELVASGTVSFPLAGYISPYYWETIYFRKKK